MTALRRLLRLAAPGIFLALPVSPAAAEGPPAPPRGYVCVKAAKPIVLDGRLDDEAWQDAPWTDDFVDIEGDRKPRPRFRTRAKMLWDDRAFYIAAELTEPHVWGTLKAHDSVIFQDNDFEIFLDPDGDNHEYGEIEINALNTEWDLLLKKPYRDGGPALNEWEVPGLKSAVKVLGTLNDPSDIDTSWTVEVAIPWAALAGLSRVATPPRDGDQWRVNFSRVEWEHTVIDGGYRKVPDRREDNWVWSPQGVIDMHRPERWGYVQFSTEAPGKAAFRPDPSAPARDALMAIYHAQKSHRERTGKWATTAKDLGLEGATPPAEIRPVGDGYEAAIRLEPREGRSAEVWTIREDSKLAMRPDRP